MAGVRHYLTPPIPLQCMGPESTGSHSHLGHEHTHDDLLCVLGAQPPLGTMLEGQVDLELLDLHAGSEGVYGHMGDWEEDLGVGGKG